MEEILGITSGISTIIIIYGIVSIIIKIIIIIKFFNMAQDVDLLERKLNEMEIQQEEQTEIMLRQEKLLAEIAGYNTDNFDNEERTVVQIHRK